MSKEKDWLDEYIDSLSEEERKALDEPKPMYYWDPVGEDLYKLDGGPYSWSPAAKDWVWDETGADIMIGELIAFPVEETELEEYKKLLEEKYGKK